MSKSMNLLLEWVENAQFVPMPSFTTKFHHFGVQIGGELVGMVCYDQEHTKIMVSTMEYVGFVENVDDSCETIINTINGGKNG